MQHRLLLQNRKGLRFLSEAAGPHAGSVRHDITAYFLMNRNAPKLKGKKKPYALFGHSLKHDDADDSGDSIGHG